MNGTINYQTLSHLGEKVKAGIATKQEKDHFMQLLFQNNSITPKQYQDYVNGSNTEDLLKAALAVGAMVLLAFLLSELAAGK